MQRKASFSHRSCSAKIHFTPVSSQARMTGFQSISPCPTGTRYSSPSAFQAVVFEMNKFYSPPIPVQPCLRILSRSDYVIQIQTQLKGIRRVFHQNLHGTSAAKAAKFPDPRMKRYHSANSLHLRSKIGKFSGKIKTAFLRKKRFRDSTDTDISAAAKFMDPQSGRKLLPHFLVIVLRRNAYKPCAPKRGGHPLRRYVRIDPLYLDDAITNAF